MQGCAVFFFGQLFWWCMVFFCHWLHTSVWLEQCKCISIIGIGLWRSVICASWWRTISEVGFLTTAWSVVAIAWGLTPWLRRCNSYCITSTEHTVLSCQINWSKLCGVLTLLGDEPLLLLSLIRRWRYTFGSCAALLWNLQLLVSECSCADEYKASMAIMRSLLL